MVTLEGYNRETGENPVRTRRCIRGRKPQSATVHLKANGKARPVV